MKVDVAATRTRRVFLIDSASAMVTAKNAKVCFAKVGIEYSIQHSSNFSHTRGENHNGFVWCAFSGDG